jgi:photosystem II stability/assembly factor-like uncharacterized protein
MTRKNTCIARAAAAILLLFACAPAMAQGAWRQVPDLGFRPMDVTANGNTIWVCGSEGSIAKSSDAGSTWQPVLHADNGALLLRIAFPRPEFGYAVGTRGTLLTTSDGGKTWVGKQAVAQPILDAAFADPQHGIIEMASGLEATADGGSTWTFVPVPQSDDGEPPFTYAFALAALDASHMVVLMKQGSAQFEPSKLLVTIDGGKTWKAVAIPSSNLYSLVVREGEYWLVGNKVVHKEVRGGYAVPWLFHSRDGMAWKSSPAPAELAVCRPHGCLAWNGALADPFASPPAYWRFASYPSLSADWAATDSVLCSVGAELACTDLARSPQLPSSRGPAPPTQLGGPRLGESVPGACLRCAYEHVLVDAGFQGPGEVDLDITVAVDGSVREVKILHAPTPSIGERMQRAAQQWLFLPSLKDGAPVEVRQNVKLRFAGVRP